MPTLAEITSSPEALERAAEDFATFHSAQAKSDEDMNQGIQDNAEFITHLSQCGEGSIADYKKFCEIGRDD